MNIFGMITRRTMKQSRSRSIVTIIGVILSTAMISAVTTFGMSMHRFLVDTSIQQEGNWHIMLENLPSDTVEKIQKDERVEEAGIITPAGFAKAVGMMDDSYRPYFFVENFSDKCVGMLNPKLAQGRLPENDSEIMIPQELLYSQENGREFHMGDTVTLELGDRMQGETALNLDTPYLSMENPDMTEEEIDSFGGEETLKIREKKTYTIVGVYEYFPWSYLSAGPAYELIAGEGEQEASGYWMIIRLKSVWDVKEFCKELWNDAPGGMVMTRNRTLLRWYGVDENQNYAAVLAGLLGIVIVLIMVASVSLIYNAFSISMRERTGQFGLLSSVGATKKQLKKALRYEAWSVCVVGIPLGLVSGVAGIGITLHFIGPLLANYMYGAGGGIPLQISWIAILLAVIIALVTVQISVWLPARRLKKISPLEAIRSSEDIKIKPGKVRKNGLAGKLFGLEGTLASKNYRRDKRKYRATVVSLTLSIVVFVTAGSYVLYMGKGSEGALLSTQVDISVDAGMDENTDYAQIENELKQTEGVKEVCRYRRKYFSVQVPAEKVNEEAKMFFTDIGDGMMLRDCIMTVLPDDQFEEYALQVGADPNEYIDQNTLKVIYKDSYRFVDADTQRYRTVSMLEMNEGAELTLGELEAVSGNMDDEKFGKMEKPFTAVLGKRADVFPRSSIQSYFSYDISMVIPESMYENVKDRMAEGELYQYYSLMTEDHRTVYQVLERERKNTESPLYPCNIYDVKEQYEQKRDITVAVQVLTTGFVVLMSLIGVANVFNTVSTNLYLRRREFAMLRSIGMTQKGFRKMMGCECLMYGLRSIVYGIVLSAGTSWLVYRSMQIGVEISYELPWVYWLISVIAVFAVVGVTMIYTMKKMGKDNVIEVLKAS